MPEEKKEEQKQKSEKSKECCCGSKNKSVAITIIVILIVILGIYLTLWKKGKEEKIALGLCSPNFPYHEYTEDELNKMYPQIKNADVPTRVTPEETYAKFRQALKENNLEMAIEQLSKESKEYDSNVNVIKEAYDQNRFSEISEAYPEEIIKNSMYESIASFYYLKEEQEGTFQQTITFIKDSNGDWKLDSL